MSCTAVLIDAAFTFEWVPVNCKRSFKRVTFMCEADDKRDNIHDPIPSVPVFYCTTDYIYFNTLCLKVVKWNMYVPFEISINQSKFNNGVYVPTLIHTYSLYLSTSGINILLFQKVSI